MFLFYVRLVVKNIFALVLFNVWIRVFEQYFRVLFIRHDKKKKKTTKTSSASYCWVYR